jgi:hypothetical protein
MLNYNELPPGRNRRIAYSNYLQNRIRVIRNNRINTENDRFNNIRNSNRLTLSYILRRPPFVDISTTSRVINHTRGRVPNIFLPIYQTIVSPTTILHRREVIDLDIWNLSTSSRPTTNIPIRPTTIRPTPIRPTPIRPIPIRPIHIRPIHIRPTPIRPIPIRPTTNTPIRPIPIRPSNNTPISPSRPSIRPSTNIPLRPIPIRYIPTRPIVSFNYESLSQLEDVKIGVINKNLLENSKVSIAEKKELCIICQDDIEIGNIIRNIKCEHNYHINCIDKWLTENKNCPLCKFSIC